MIGYPSCFSMLLRNSAFIEFLLSKLSIFILIIYDYSYFLRNIQFYNHIFKWQPPLSEPLSERPLHSSKQTHGIVMLANLKRSVLILSKTNGFFCSSILLISHLSVQPKSLIFQTKLKLSDKLDVKLLDALLILISVIWNGPKNQEPKVDSAPSTSHLLLISINKYQQNSVY